MSKIARHWRLGNPMGRIIESSVSSKLPDTLVGTASGHRIQRNVGRSHAEMEGVMVRLSCLTSI